MWRGCRGGVAGASLQHKIDPAIPSWLMNEMTKLSQGGDFHPLGKRWRVSGEEMVSLSPVGGEEDQRLTVSCLTPQTPALIIFSCHLPLSLLCGLGVTIVVTVGV
ncbi:hypothetical protein E2C01_096089 [Portunus trituberculatus]|uniref:Uncharacterized protein n=1 Tax=Portunus trituberculatus TaxID=210409 RepID=A0A5B7K251_PORTR|nr:hypothetical protein [Portunus trituberculatus]